MSLFFLYFFALIVLSDIVKGSYSGGVHGDLYQIRKQGFDQDPRTFSHEIVAPWKRPFKPGYCESWEWHTDPRYKEQRLQICRELSGSKRNLIFLNDYLNYITFYFLIKT